MPNRPNKVTSLFEFLSKVQETPAENNFFGNMQVKSKPAPGAGASKAKGFDPFNLGGPSANRPSTGGPNFAGFTASGIVNYSLQL